MAPKKVVKDGPAKRVAVELAAQQLAAEDAARKKLQQSHLVTALKRGKTEAEASALQLYSSLAKNAPLKSEMLQKWLGDKSCKWHSSYTHDRNYSLNKTDTELTGHGTECLCKLM